MKHKITLDEFNILPSVRYNVTEKKFTIAWLFFKYSASDEKNITFIMGKSKKRVPTDKDGNPLTKAQIEMQIKVRKKFDMFRKLEMVSNKIMKDHA
jgi:hypothetical protein